MPHYKVRAGFEVWVNAHDEGQAKEHLLDDLRDFMHFCTYHTDNPPVEIELVPEPKDDAEARSMKEDYTDLTDE